MSQDEQLWKLLKRTDWADSDVEELARLSRTRIISFAPGSRFAPGALRHLSRLRILQFLSFKNSELAPDDMGDLAQIGILSRLDLEGCTIRDPHIERLAQNPGALPKLQDLWLDQTGITDKSLPHIARFAQLKELILGGTQISDAGLQQLKRLQKLRMLLVNDTQISDAGIMQLATLPRLSMVGGRNSKITQAGLDALFAAQVQNSKTSFVEPKREDVEAATQILREFMQAMHDWECNLAQRAGEIEKWHESERPAPNVLGPDEWAATQQFWAEAKAGKAAILARFCTAKRRVYSEGFSYGTPPQYEPRTLQIVDAEQPSPRKLILFVEMMQYGSLRNKFRFVLLKKGETWRLDSKQWWSDGWERGIL